MTDVLTPDLCIVGGGSGGLSTAAAAAQMGARVVLVEGGKMGGDCLNYGCVPSKALIAAGKHAHAMTAGAGFGVTPVAPEIDFAKVKDHVFSVIAKIEPHDSVERFESLGVIVIAEFGSFISPTELQAGDTVIKARRFVVATGSSPLVPPIPGIEDVPYDTNETIFEMRERPDHLIVIGGGSIGMEMAQAHNRLGCKVTVLEALKALGRSLPEHAAVVLEQVRGEGVEIFEDTAAREVRSVNGSIEISTSDGNTVVGSALLVAVGRKPNIEKLNLGAAGIRHARTGIEVDQSLKTSNRRVYAIGDVSGGPQFTHVAGYHSGVVIKSALFGLPSKARVDHIPSATYTDPEIAEVGLSNEQARKTYGDRVEVASFDYEENDRAIAEGCAKGQVRVLVVKGRPVGASIVGPQAGELIQTWSMAISGKLKMATVASMISPYPTLGEINKRTAGAFFSNRLFGNRAVARMVSLVQRF